MAYHSLFPPGRPARRVSENIESTRLWSSGGYDRCNALWWDATVASHLPCRINGPGTVTEGGM
jgi:hypothetical protein